MRNWKAWALGLGALGLVGLFFQTGNNAVAQSSGPFDRSAAISGYFTLVDSLWANDASAGIGYHVVNAPAGYKFDGFHIIGYLNAVAEDITVRPWYSAADSTSILTNALKYYFATDDTAVRPLPIKCHKLSVVGLSATSDVRILGFCRRK